MNEESFKAWKYFSAKFVLPLIAMILWSALINADKLQTDEHLFGVGIGLLTFSGMFSLQSAWETYWKAKGGKYGKEESN